jgi:hypothetical protein
VPRECGCELEALVLELVVRGKVSTVLVVSQRKAETAMAFQDEHRMKLQCCSHFQRISEV